MEVKLGYRQTEMGVIPSDWELARLGDVVLRFSNGGTPSTKHEAYWTGDIPWITGADILDQRVSEIRRFITKDAVANSSTSIIGRGHLLLVSRTGVGKLAIAPFDVAISQDFTGVFTRGEVLRANYLFRFLDLHQSILTRENQGTSILGITRETLSALTIFFPPTVSEQEAIAVALSDADALIESLDQLLVKKRLLKQGAMQELLTGKKRLPGFEGEWETPNLGQVLRLHYGKSQRGIAVDGGAYPILGTGGEVGRTDKPLYDKPSVILGRKGTIDEPQYAETPFWAIDTTYYSEVSNAAVPKFLFYKCNTIRWRSYNEASGVPSLSATTVESIDITLPSVAEQRAIAAVLSDMDLEITALEAKVAKACQIKQGMMQELLTGRIRLV